MRAVSLPVSPVARNRKDSTPRRAGRLLRCGISIRLTSVVGQESVSANLGGIDRAPAGLNPHVLPDAPARLLQPLQERPEAGLPYRIVCGCGHEHPDAPHAIGLLRPRRERPRRRAAESGYQFSPPDGDWHVTLHARAAWKHITPRAQC